MQKQNLNQSESGRSMVEMLGVLAVIGVLSVGGIAGYKFAMKKNVENEITNFLQYLKLMVDTENPRDDSPLKVIGETKEFRRQRNEVLCTYVDDSLCQEYVSPKDGHTDIGYFMGNHFFWQIAQYTDDQKGSGILPAHSENIKVAIGYALHHPSFAADADICRNMVHAVVQTFGDQFGGFNYSKVGQTADDMIENVCNQGKGFQPFNIILSVVE